LQCRRVKADLVLCYKLLHGLTNIKSDDFIILSPNVNLQGNQFKLVKPMITSARDKNFFVIELLIFGTLYRTAL
jgi:hypothetical protein